MIVKTLGGQGKLNVIEVKCECGRTGKFIFKKGFKFEKIEDNNFENNKELKDATQSKEKKFFIVI
ncbi:MAG: hypothetical protein NC925_03590 [Candidatus Omnitrophica bacterium]|nr:hypothetical protein [Candidatus Omnitrophota bacterium]